MIDHDAPIEVNDNEFLYRIFEDYFGAALVCSKQPEANGFHMVPWLDAFKTWKPDEHAERYYSVSLFRVDSNGEHNTKQDPRYHPYRRLKQLWHRQYVLVVDDVHEKIPAAKLASWPPPHFVLRTSHGNNETGDTTPSEQWGWYLDLEEQQNADQIEYFLGEIGRRYTETGEDPGMEGVNRVLKLPSSFNMKKKRQNPDGSWFKTEVRHWAPTNPRYTIAQLANAAGIDIAMSNVKKRSQSLDWDYESPINEHIDIQGTTSDGGVLCACPNEDSHTRHTDDGKSIALYHKSDGGIIGKCQHSCGVIANDVLYRAIGGTDLLTAQKRYILTQSTSTVFKDVPPPNGAEVTNKPANEVLNRQNLGVADTTVVANQKATNPVVVHETPNGDPQAPESSSIEDWIAANIPSTDEAMMAAQGWIEVAIETLKLKDVALDDFLIRLKEHWMGAGQIATYRKMAKKVLAKRAKAMKVDKIHKALAVKDGVMKVLHNHSFKALPGEIEYSDPFPEEVEADAKMTVGNLKTMCDHHGITVALNTMTRLVDVRIPNYALDDEDTENDSIQAITDIAKCSMLRTEGINGALKSLSQANKYHPVLLWLDQLPPWDAQGDYVQALFNCMPVVEKDRDMSLTYFRNWMRQGIVAAKASYGDAPPRNVLTLLGAQYGGKTTFFRRLAPTYPDGSTFGFKEGMHLDLNNKDSVKKAITAWIVELGEVGGTMRKSDIDALKAHISNGEDEMRLPYAQAEIRWKRQTIYCASVNDLEFLRDETGNTRWNVIELTGPINLDQMRIYQENGLVAKAWKQAEAEVNQGALWYLDREIVAAYSLRQDKFRRQSEAESVLIEQLDWEAPLDKWRNIQPTVLQEKLGIRKTPPGGWKQLLVRLVKDHTGQVDAHEGRKEQRGWKLPPMLNNGRAVVIQFPEKPGA